MRFHVRWLVLGIAIVLLSLPQLPAVARGAPGSHPVSASDLTLARHVSHLAARSPGAARQWATEQPGIIRVVLGRDRATLDLFFHDGAELVVLPRTPRSRPFIPLFRASHSAAGAPAGGRAVVLEPFQDELGLPANAGQIVVDNLKKAGFTVDIFRNNQVTVNLLLHMSDYSVIYLETHSGTLQNGDAILNTASTDYTNYKAYMSEYGGDGSVKQALSAGTGTIYLAITGKFVAAHVPLFPDSSFIYLDGCDIYGADLFWHDLQSKNVGAMVTWDSHVFQPSAETADEYMFGQLAAGKSLTESLDYTAAAGYAVGLGDQGTAHLKMRGDGRITLEKARTEATPEPTATDTPTVTPTPGPTDTATPSPSATATPAAKRLKKCKKGKHRVHGKCVRIKKARRK